MTYDGDFKGEEWNNGRLTTRLGNSYEVVKGIPDFVKDSNDEFGTKVRENNWAEKNWSAEKRRYENMEYCRDTAKIVTNIGGNILEVGAGPGGGIMPHTLFADSRATFLINDISKMVLEDWQRLLKDQNKYENISYAAFDAREMPIQSESFDVVTTSSISNIESGAEAIQEMYRVLKPGGFLIAIDGEIPQEDLMRLPKEVTDSWANEGHSRGLVELFKDTGFKILEKTIISQRNAEPEGDSFQRTADKYGVQLRFTFVRVVAQKPL